MSDVDDALDYARSARAQCDEPSLPDLKIIALADEVERLRAIDAKLRAIETRAQGVITDGGPDETPTARYILNGRN